MKNISIKIAGFVAVFFVLSACNNKLNVEPLQSIDASQALVDDQSVESAVIGAYASIGAGALYGTNFNLLPELQASSNYISWQGTFDSYRQVTNKTMTSVNGEASRTWIAAYSAINVANNVLDALSLVKDADLKKTLQGEALFIRSILYFELVRLYALPYISGTTNSQIGVPIVLTPTKTQDQALTKTPRSTVEQVYQRVISDLTLAATLLPEDNGVRASKFSVLGFLARVYLQQSNYASALNAANTVIESGRFGLNPDIKASFKNKNSSESIFEIQQNDQNNAGTSNDGLTTFYASMLGIGRGDVRVLEAFADLYEADDIRGVDEFNDNPAPNNLRKLLYYGNGARAGRIRSGKWIDFGGNIPVIRLSEMILIRAETNLRLGSSVGSTPINDLNIIRLRSGASTYAVATIDEILLERRLELAFEGFRMHDLKRLRQSTGSFTFNDPKLVFPIPKREVDATAGVISQNPGY